MNDAVIVSAVRTPIGGLNGSLASVPATALGSIAIAEALVRAGVSGSEVDEAIMGNVLSAGVGQAPARQAALRAGLPNRVRCAERFHISRAEQDEFAGTSYRRARSAELGGDFKKEIVAVTLAPKNGDSRVAEEDEEIRRFDAEKMRALKPASGPMER